MLTVGDLMQPEVIAVDPGLTLRSLADLLAQRHISGAPVLEQGRLIGVVTTNDVLSYLASLPGVPTERTDFLEQDEVAPPDEWEPDEPASTYFVDVWDDAGANVAERFERLEGPEWDILEEHTVAEAMTRAVATLPPETGVAVAARYLSERNIHRVLVTVDGSVVGILTTTDLVRALADGRLVAAEPEGVAIGRLTDDEGATMSVGKICSRVVATATPEETVAVAARRMVRNEVGTLVVVEGGGSNRAVGIVTDRDITTRCVAADRDPAETPLAEVMTKPVRVVGEQTPIEEGLARMAGGGIRRLVVTDPVGHLVGVLSLDDVLELILEEGGSIRRVLEHQRPSVPA